jgi:hypothetical protein
MSPISIHSPTQGGGREWGGGERDEDEQNGRDQWKKVSTPKIFVNLAKKPKNDKSFYIPIKTKTYFSC